MNVERVAMVVHDGKPKAVELEKELTNWLETRGVTVADSEPDLVVSLGGDGTVLRAARHAHSSDAPLLAVNLGHIGYLTEVEAGTAQEAIARVFTDDFTLEERMMLACDVDSGEPTSFVGLNEILVERTSRVRLVRLDVRVGGERLATFNADGIIVATPTGSTAYALSAGGPIVSPRAQCLVVVPVSPHMIFSRAVVLAPDETVEITVGGGGPADRDHEAAVVLDGAEGCSVGHGDTVIARRHDRPLRLIRLSGPGFLERLRFKLDLPA